MLRRLIPDAFVLLMLGVVALAWVAPVSAAPAAIVDVVTYVAIFALFFLHGARLPREALVAGFADVKLHAAILLITFGLFPLFGLALAWAAPHLLDPLIWTGLLFLCTVPSTVQSSIAYTSMAGGNVAGAVAAAAFSNMAGVFLTPVLASLVAGAGGAAVSAAGVGRIFALLFLPFLLGHGLRRWVFPFLSARPQLAVAVDKGTILLAVYGAFSAAMADGVFTRIPGREIFLLGGMCLLLLALILGSAWLVGRAGRFSPGSRAAILFCGSVKSLASGAPMAKLLFPAADAAIVLVPVMLYHMLQLLVCATIAGTLKRRRSMEAAGAGAPAAISSA